MKRLILVATAVGALFASAPVANADEYGYLDWLADEGEDVSTYEIQRAAVNYGYAICNLYRASQSNSHVLNFMMERGNMTDDQIALYTIASVRELCPHLGYLVN